MISLIVITLIALTFATAGGYYLYTIIYNESFQLAAQKNDLFLKQLTLKLELNSKPLGPNGEYMLPYGENITSSYQTVPSWISTIRKNPWGKYVIYCPFGATNTGTMNTTVSMGLNGSANYSVETVSDFRTKVDGAQRSYIISSQYQDVNGNGILDPAPDFNGDGVSDSIAGVLISPYPNSNNVTPTCNSVQYLSSENAFVATGGKVSVIYQQDAESMSALNNISPSNVSQSGGNIFNVTNAGSNTLINNFNYYNGFSNIPVATFYLPNGNSDIQTGESFVNSTKNPEEIILKGVVDNPSTTAIEKSVVGSSTANPSDTTTAGVLSFDGYTVILDNVHMDPTTRLVVRNGTLYTEGNSVDLSNVYLDNSTLNVETTTNIVGSLFDNVNDLLNSKTSSIYLKNSNLNITNQTFNVNLDANDTWGLYGFNSHINIEGNGSTDNVNINTQGHSNKYGIVLYESNYYQRNAITKFLANNTQTMGFYLDSASKVHSFNSTINFSGYEQNGIYMRGLFVGLNTNMAYSSSGVNGIGINMYDGSKLILRGTTALGGNTTSNRPYIGIEDNGANFIGGGSGSVNVYARSKCWQGPNATDERIFGATNTTTGTSADIGTNGVSSQAKDTSNASYEAFRLSNNSNWNCNI